MKKELLFIVNTLHCGGTEKALLSLLQTLDYSTYSVDLFVFKHEGLFFDSLPKAVTVLPEQKRVSYFYMSTFAALALALRRLDFRAFYARVMLTVLSKRYTNGVWVEQYFWKYYSKVLAPLEKQYAAAIGFQEKNPTYFCVDKVQAGLKMGWVHTDLEVLQLDFEQDAPYFAQLDYLVPVSSGLAVRLQECLPQYASKITPIENILSVSLIRQLAQVPVAFNLPEGVFSLVSVGRLAKEKGLFLGLEALSILRSKGYAVHWYLIGEGNQKAALQTAAASMGVSDSLFFLGLKENPYPYLQRCDLFLLPSLFEGKSISLEEAKVLAKPIVITNFSSATDQIQHGITGLITAMDGVALAAAVEQLLLEPALRSQFSAALLATVAGNETELLKFDALVSHA